MDCQGLFDAIDALNDKYIAFWTDVCLLESPTENKAAVDAVGAYFIARAREMGWDVEVFEHPLSGNCVTITMNPDAPLPPIALSGHMDTVHPIGLFGTPAVRREGNMLYGPGVTDCKGGTVASFMAMEALQSCGFTERPVKLILQSDEEGGSRMSEKATVAYMARAAKDCVAFLNTEGATPGKLTLERKGIARYRFEISGTAAHSSRCYEGVSAVAEAAHKILALEKWKDKDGITCNCGIIEGGTTPNTVPAACTFVADIRYKTETERVEVERRVKEIAATSYLGGTTCKISPFSHRVAMEYNARNAALFDRICAIYDAVGLPHVEPALSTGGSDAADMTAYGIPVLDCFGVVGGKIHSKDEFAYVDSLAASAKMQAAAVYFFDMEKEQL
ncbi:MAG: M20/M25/M40 family metallo-hydrolase [Clostridia bacterium]|nr:M20/M25/M40 family metallo-hydrolase [Clostridia bacterium]